MSEELDALRKIFLQRHKEWEKANNAEGCRTGECRKRWELRLKALLELVHAQDNKTGE